MTTKKSFFAMLVAVAAISASVFTSCKGKNGGGDSPFAKKQPESVVINGVRWATRNVDAPGTFAKNPEDVGMFYRWNRKVGWSSTNPPINSDGGTFCDESQPTGNIWEKANDPSPAGYRMPTEAELETLLNVDKVSSQMATINGVSGAQFTDKTSNESVFFPFAGSRYYYDGYNRVGKLFDVGSAGFYWCSTLDPIGRICYANYLRVDSGTSSYSKNLYGDNCQAYSTITRKECNTGMSVRPVAE
jgi:uncharacterized protein (TIGR02145 family)